MLEVMLIDKDIFQQGLRLIQLMMKHNWISKVAFFV